MKNLIILTIARSGSSMVTSIFKGHGYNTSKGQHASLRDGAQYWTFESPDLKAYYRHNRIMKPGDLANFHTYKNTEQFRGLVSALGEPWVIKTGIEKWPLFECMDAAVVKVRRDIKATARSMSTKKNEPYEQTLTNIRNKAKLFDRVPGVEVYTDELIAGDYSSLEAACAACGVEFDPAIADKCIKPGDWHYGASAAA